MTKKAFFTNADQATVDSYKKWIRDLSGALDEIGFIRSADAGQVDINAISAVPPTSTSTHYEIRYLNDSLHAEAPIYVRIEYGSRNINTPYIGITVGTGTNGSGTITGIFGDFGPTRSSAVLTGTGAPYQCYACMVEGLVWFVFADGRQNTSDHPALASLVIARTTDSTGAPTADGAAAYFNRQSWDNFSPSTRSFKNSWGSNPAGYTSSSPRGFGGNDANSTGFAWTFLPLNISSSTDSEGRKQIVPHILPFPEFQVVQQIVSILPSDGIAHGTQFEAAIVGADLRNYIVITGFRASSKERFALIWE